MMVGVLLEAAFGFQLAILVNGANLERLAVKHNGFRA